MKLTTAVRLLRLLPTRPESALTTHDIHRLWHAQGGPDLDLRSIQNYMKELSEDMDIGPALVAIVPPERRKGNDREFYLQTSQVANWFVTEEAALEMLLSHDVLNRAFGPQQRVSGQKLADMAGRVVASAETQRLRERVRIVPDGIGRLPARIDPLVLAASITAVAQDRQLEITYKSAGGGGTAKNHLLSPLGLVHKDGTIYLVGVKGLADAPLHFALHRVSRAECHHQLAQARPDFKLEQYIVDSHQFSHVLDGKAVPLRLKLRVAPKTMFHFRERPLSADQEEVPPEGDETWFIVTATVPRTWLLTPFLISLGRWIEVLEPAELRAEATEWVEGMWAHYAPDNGRGR